MTHAYLLLAKTREHVQETKIATHATVDQAIMEIDVSIETHAYLLLAKTQEHVEETIIATHAAVYQAIMEIDVSIA